MDKVIKIFKIIAIGVWVILVVTIGLLLLNNNEKKLGNGYWYDIEGKRVFGENLAIPPNAEIILNNDNYVLVGQNPLSTKEEAIYGKEFYYSLGRDSTYYWIIFKQEKKYKGPLTKDELLKILKDEAIKIQTL